MRPESGRSRPVITLLTDFGGADHFVGVMKGVIAGICPQALVIDLSHDVPPGQLLAGALILRFAYEYFPTGTIHVVVVDPGVGSDRDIVACRSSNHIFLAPDNGILWPALEDAGPLESVWVEESTFFLPEVSSTFHGRDIFASVAAHLATGIKLRQLGPPTKELKKLHLPCPRIDTDGAIQGNIIYVDHFGNLISNIPAGMLDELKASSGKLGITLAGVHIEGLSHSYTEVASGKLLALVGSAGFLEIAARDGSAQHITGIAPGKPVTVVVG